MYIWHMVANWVCEATLPAILTLKGLSQINPGLVRRVKLHDSNSSFHSPCEFLQCFLCEDFSVPTTPTSDHYI